MTGLFAGPGATVLDSDELLTRVTLTLPKAGGASVYAKLGQRKALAIAIASTAVVFDPISGTVRIALGSVAPTVVRAWEAERLFATGWAAATHGGAARDDGPINARARESMEELIEAVAVEAVGASDPIDDVRASAEYRMVLVKELTRTALEELCLAEPRVSG